MSTPKRLLTKKNDQEVDCISWLGVNLRTDTQNTCAGERLGYMLEMC